MSERIKDNLTVLFFAQRAHQQEIRLNLVSCQNLCPLDTLPAFQNSASQLLRSQGW